MLTRHCVRKCNDVSFIIVEVFFFWITGRKQLQRTWTMVFVILKLERKGLCDSQDKKPGQQNPRAPHMIFLHVDP